MGQKNQVSLVTRRGVIGASMNSVLLSLLLHLQTTPNGRLLLAICTVESSLRPHVVNIDDGGSNNHSFGLCQVSYRTAVEMLGMPSNRDCVWNLETGRCPLFKPDINLYYAEKYLNYQLKRYNNDIKKAVSAYNAGKAIKSNKNYVRNVLNLLAQSEQLTYLPETPLSQ